MFSAFDIPKSDSSSINLNARRGRDFSPERKQKDSDLFNAVRNHIQDRIALGKKVIISCQSVGARDRLLRLLGEHGIQVSTMMNSWSEIPNILNNIVSLLVSPYLRHLYY